MAKASRISVVISPTSPLPLRCEAEPVGEDGYRQRPGDGVTDALGECGLPGSDVAGEDEYGRPVEERQP